MDPETTAFIAALDRGLKNVSQHFIGKPITSTTLECFKQAFQREFDRIAPFQDYGDYLNVFTDSRCPDQIIVRPKGDAPLWVWQAFGYLEDNAPL